MIPDWATHVGHWYTVTGDRRPIYLRREGDGWQSSSAGRYYTVFKLLDSIRPITPEMRREALVAEHKAAIEAARKAHRAWCDACDVEVLAARALRRFNSEHGTGDDKCE